MDADTRGNTNAQTKTRNRFQIIIKHQSLLHFEKKTVIRNISFLYHSKFVLKISTPFDTNQNSDFLVPKRKAHESIACRKDTLWWHGLVLRWEWGNRNKLLRLKVKFLFIEFLVWLVWFINDGTLRKIYTDVFIFHTLTACFICLFISLALYR